MAAPESFDVSAVSGAGLQTMAQPTAMAGATFFVLVCSSFLVSLLRRYIASQFDNIRTVQERSVLRYRIAPSDWIDLDAAAYRIDFSRN